MNDLSHKVYLIACCFPPFGRGNAITNACVANGLAEQFDVHVVSMDLEEGGVISYQEDRSLVQGLDSKLRVHRIAASRGRTISTLLYALGILPCYFLNWAWSVWSRREEIFSGKAMVFAVYPVFSDLVVAYFVSRRYGFPLLVDFRDDFSGVMARGWRRVLRPYYRYMERRIIRAAHRISVTTDMLRLNLLERYDLPEEKIEVVYNIVPHAKGEQREPKEVGKAPLRIIYAGAMSRVQKPEVLLKAYAALLETDAEWNERLRVDLFGPESHYFKLAIKKYIVDGCSFGGFLPQITMAQRVAESDIGFFSLSDATYAYATPTKLFDYIQAGVPILASLPQGASREIIERHEIGLVVDAGDIEALAEALKSMVADRSYRQRCRDNMMQLREEFGIEKQIGRWADMLSELAAEYLKKEAVMHFDKINGK